MVSLDAGRSWFRYHHLFADLLQLALRRTAPGEVTALHEAAAGWFAEHGFAVEAIRHAQAAQDWGLAARLLADNYVDLVFHFFLMIALAPALAGLALYALRPVLRGAFEERPEIRP